MTHPENCPHCGRGIIKYERDGFVVLRCSRFCEDGDKHFFSVYDSREGYGNLGDHGKPHEAMFDAPHGRATK